MDNSEKTDSTGGIRHRAKRNKTKTQYRNNNNSIKIKKIRSLHTLCTFHWEEINNGVIVFYYKYYSTCRFMTWTSPLFQRG